MYGWISALAVSAIGSLVAMGIVRGWSVFWRWPIGRPDIREVTFALPLIRGPFRRQRLFVEN